MTNPYMSLWLSGANAWAGAARGFWAAQTRQQRNALTQEMMRWWMSAWLDTPATTGKGRTRR
jgi:hypothetical protein